MGRLVEREYIYLDWCGRFNCPGGDCGLTCCTADWRIKLSDEEIEGYKRMDHPFRDELLSAIDFDEKCQNGKCMMLDEKQYCKLVSNCGAKALSYTCSGFPWKVRDYGTMGESMVEIVCPVVAKYLFDNKPISFENRKVKAFWNKMDGTDEQVLEKLLTVKSGLLYMLGNTPGKYAYGKLFLLLKVIEETEKMISKGNLTADSAELLAENYLADNVTKQIFEQCEQVGNGIDLRSDIIYGHFVRLMQYGAGGFLHWTYSHKPYFRTDVEIWLSDAAEFKKDLKNYVEVMRKTHPMFADKLLAYFVFCSCALNNEQAFYEMIPVRMLEAMFIQLAGMAVLREKGAIDVHEFSVLIASVDRPLNHAGNGADLLGNSVDIVRKMDTMSLVMSFIA